MNQNYARYYREKFHLSLKFYGDRLRSRRLVPHQTDVDKFFRRLTEKEVHFIFGNLLNAVNRTIRQKIIGGSKLRVLVDNTEYAYYGHAHHPFEIGTHRHPGTQKARLFQGIALQGSGMTLFSEFRLLRYNQYRAKHIGVATEWLRWQGFSLSYALMDREFYRAALVKELKSRHLPVIIPAKKYQFVVHELNRFLHGSRPLVASYLFQQTQGTKPWPSAVNLHLALVAHNGQSALDIRRAYRQGQLSLDEALHQLAGFFTTLHPSKNHASWCRWLARTYKKRWCQETAFRMLNEIHPSFRNRYPTVQLAQLYLRGIIYNQWQTFLKGYANSTFPRWQFGLHRYQQYLKHQVEHEFMRSIRENVGFLQKKRREVFFNT
jgi:hypothetical protein